MAPTYSRFSEFASSGQAGTPPITDMASLQAALDEAYADPGVAARAGTGDGLPPIRPGKLTLSYEETLAWLRERRPLPERPDRRCIGALHAVRQAIVNSTPAVARVVLATVTAGSECWPPEFIAAMPDERLPEMLEAAVEFLIVRSEQVAEEEASPNPVPATVRAASVADRREEIREARARTETRGPPKRKRRGRETPARSSSIISPSTEESYCEANDLGNWRRLGEVINHIVRQLGGDYDPR